MCWFGWDSFDLNFLMALLIIEKVATIDEFLGDDEAHAHSDDFAEHTSALLGRRTAP